jgi:hypothetical protein
MCRRFLAGFLFLMGVLGLVWTGVFSTNAVYADPNGTCCPAPQVTAPPNQGKCGPQMGQCVSVQGNNACSGSRCSLVTPLDCQAGQATQNCYKPQPTYTQGTFPNYFYSCPQQQNCPCNLKQNAPNCSVQYQIACAGDGC